LEEGWTARNAQRSTTGATRLGSRLKPQTPLPSIPATHLETLSYSSPRFERAQFEAAAGTTFLLKLLFVAEVDFNHTHNADSSRCTTTSPLNEGHHFSIDSICFPVFTSSVRQMSSFELDLRYHYRRAELGLLNRARLLKMLKHDTISPLSLVSTRSREGNSFVPPFCLLDHSHGHAHSSSLSSSSSLPSSAAATFLAGFFFFFLFLLFAPVDFANGLSRILRTSSSSIFLSDLTFSRSSGGGAASRMIPFFVMAATC
jgi:hypothetical protein